MSIRISEVDTHVNSIIPVPNADSLVAIISTDNKLFNYKVGLLSDNILEDISVSNKLFSITQDDVNNLPLIQNISTTYNDLSNDYYNGISNQVSLITSDYPAHFGEFVNIDNAISSKLTSITGINITNLYNRFNSISNINNDRLSTYISDVSVLSNNIIQSNQLLIDNNIDYTQNLINKIKKDLYGSFISDNDFLEDELSIPNDDDIFLNKYILSNFNIIVDWYLIPFLNDQDFSIYELHVDMSSLYSYISSIQFDIFNNLTNIVINNENIQQFDKYEDINLTDCLQYSIISAEQLFKNYELVEYEISNLFEHDNTNLSINTIIDNITDISSYILDYYNSISSVTKITTNIYTLYTFLDSIYNKFYTNSTFNNNLTATYKNLSGFINKIREIKTNESTEILTCTINNHKKYLSNLSNCVLFLDTIDELELSVNNLTVQLLDENNQLNNFKQIYIQKFNEFNSLYTEISTASNSFNDFFTTNVAKNIRTKYNDYATYHNTNYDNIYTESHNANITNINNTINDIKIKFKQIKNNLLQNININIATTIKQQIKNICDNINNAAEINTENVDQYYYIAEKLPDISDEVNTFIERCYTAYNKNYSDNTKFINYLFNANIYNANIDTLQNFSNIITQINTYNFTYFKIFFTNVKDYIYEKILNTYINAFASNLQNTYDTYLKQNFTFLKDIGICNLKIENIIENYPEQKPAIIRDLKIQIKNSDKNILYQYPDTDNTLSSVFPYFNKNVLAITIEDSKLINNININNIYISCNVHYINY